MAGIFDLLSAAMGRPDPRMQIAAAFNQAPGQAGSNTGPMPLPGAAGAAPGGGGSPGAPTAGGPPAANSGAPGGGAPAGAAGGSPAPTPQAYTSPPDLIGMYTQLAQRQQANEGFNRGIGMMAAAFAPPRDRGLIMNSMSGQSGNADDFMRNVIGLQQFNTQQLALDAFRRSAPDLAQKLHMTPDEIMAAGPSAVTTAMQLNLPPEAMKNWMFAKNQWIASHPEDPSGAEFEKQFPMSMAIVGSIPGLSDLSKQRTLALQDWQGRNPGQTAPGFLTNDQEFSDYHKSLADAQGNFAGLNTQSQQALDTIARLKANPKLGTALQVMSTTGGAGSDFLSSYKLMDQNTKAAIDDLKLLGGQVYTEGFKSTGSRRTQQEVNAIVAGLSKVGNYGEQNYGGNVLDPLADRIREGQAANYGAAQQLDTLPDSLKPSMAKIGSIYLPGGSLYSGQGGKGWYLKGMSDADADAAVAKLPPGAVFIGPDGQPHKRT